MLFVQPTILPHSLLTTPCLQCNSSHICTSAMCDEWSCDISGWSGGSSLALFCKTLCSSSFAIHCFSVSLCSLLVQPTIRYFLLRLATSYLGICIAPFLVDTNHDYFTGWGWQALDSMLFIIFFFLLFFGCWNGVLPSWWTTIAVVVCRFTCGFNDNGWLSRVVVENIQYVGTYLAL